MPVPLEYARASAEFDRFLEELRVALGHETRHMAYQTLEAVLRVFRRRLGVADAIAFAAALPAVLRAIFVDDWDTAAALRAFTDRAAIATEVQHYRGDHNMSPESAIEDVATVLRRHVDPVAFERALARLPPEAAAFWASRSV